MSTSDAIAVLSPTRRRVLVDIEHPKGAFCIPGVDPLPYGRVWGPAQGSFRDSQRARQIEATRARGYTHFEYLVSGKPYGNDYDPIPADAARVQRDLTEIRTAGLSTIVAFDDARGSDLSYLRPVAALTQDLVDWVMGIYEVNGVFKNPDVVLDVLKQSRALYPKARLAVHFTPLDEGQESYGLVDWRRAKDEAGLNCLFFQSANWNDPPAIAARYQDFTRRLGGPDYHGYPTLSHGVVLFELSTTRTYRDWTEAQGVQLTNTVLRFPQAPERDGTMSVPPTGFMDGGSV